MGRAHSWVLMDSVGVTASRDSVTPAAKPARAARGPVTLPSASARRLLYWSKATNPGPPPVNNKACPIGRSSGGTYVSRPWPSCQ